MVSEDRLSVEHLKAAGTPRVHVVKSDSAAVGALHRVAKSLGFHVYDLDAGGIGSGAALLAKIAAPMSFPPSYGANWDALLDFLRDLSWDPAPGYLLVIRNPENLLHNDPEAFGTLMEIGAQATADWNHQKIPFHFVVAGSDAVARAVMERPLRVARPDQFPLHQIATVCDDRAEGT